MRSAPLCQPGLCGAKEKRERLCLQEEQLLGRRCDQPMGETDPVIDSTSSNAPTPSEPPAAEPSLDVLPIPDASAVPVLQADVVMAEAAMPCSLASLLNLGDPGMAGIAQRMHSFLELKDLHSLAQVSRDVRESVDKPRTEQWRAHLKEESKHVAHVDPRMIYDRHFTEFVGAKQMGKNRAPDMREISEPRDRSTDRPLQALQQLSFLLFSVASKLHPPEQEIQCLLFNGNLVITANCVQSVDALHEVAQNGLAANKPFFNVMSEAIPGVDIRKRDSEIVSPSQRTPFAKAAKLFDRVANPKPGDTFVRDELRATLQIDSLMRPTQPDTDAVSNLYKVDVNGLGDLLADSTPKIIFLQPGASHAEQNFVHCFQEHPELWRLGPAFIAGKKRPCAACLTTLDLFAARYPMELHYVHRGGTYFTTAVPGLETLIQKGVECGHFSQPQINKWLADNIAQQKSYRTKRKVQPATEGDTGYGSVSESDVEKTAFDKYVKQFNRPPVRNTRVPGMPGATPTTPRRVPKRKNTGDADGQPPKKKKSRP